VKIRPEGRKEPIETQRRLADSRPESGRGAWAGRHVGTQQKRKVWECNRKGAEQLKTSVFMGSAHKDVSLTEVA